MNRTQICLLCLMVTSVVVPLSAATITGRVFDDVNVDGIADNDEQLSGIRLQLFRDDGDGQFGVSDTEIHSLVSGDNGLYVFSDLAASSNYFVVQPSQIIDATNYLETASLVTTASDAAFVIDNFSHAQTATSSPNTRQQGTVMPASDGILGGERDFHLEHLSGNADTKLRANAFGLNPVLAFDQSAGVVSVATITWDGIDGDADSVAMGLGGADLTQSGMLTGLEIRAGIDAAGDGEMIVARLYDAASDTYAEATAALPVTDGTATESLIIPFESFVGGAVDPTHVDAIQLQLGGMRPSIDMQLDFVGFTAPTILDISVEPSFTVLPEPSSLFGLCLGLLFAHRTFRRS